MAVVFVPLGLGEPHKVEPGRADRSPYCGLLSRRSTTRSEASGVASASKARASAGEGGRPIRSTLPGWSHSAGVAGGAGHQPRPEARPG